MHSVAHIEFCAIDLALDCAYRFRNMPKTYYFDWIEVAKEEVEHFNRLNELLNQVGFKYGDFLVHDLLFSSMQKADLLLDRIALVPRGMEAVGLDVNPFLCTKVSQSSHKIKTPLLEVLQIIYNEEISHVSKGDKWFHYICEEQKIPLQKRATTYIEILKKHCFSFPKANSSMNVEARLKAGFSKEELELLSDVAFASSNPK